VPSAGHRARRSSGVRVRIADLEQQGVGVDRLVVHADPGEEPHRAREVLGEQNVVGGRGVSSRVRTSVGGYVASVNGSSVPAVTLLNPTLPMCFGQ